MIPSQPSQYLTQPLLSSVVDVKRESDASTVHGSVSDVESGGGGYYADSSAGEGGSSGEPKKLSKRLRLYRKMLLNHYKYWNKLQTVLQYLMYLFVVVVTVCYEVGFIVALLLLFSLRHTDIISPDSIMAISSFHLDTCEFHIVALVSLHDLISSNPIHILLYYRQLQKMICSSALQLLGISCGWSLLTYLEVSYIVWCCNNCSFYEHMSHI